MPDVSPLQGLVGRRVALPDHFVDAGTIEDARPLGSGAELRFRQANGERDEAVLSPEYLAPLLVAFDWARLENGCWSRFGSWGLIDDTAR